MSVSTGKVGMQKRGSLLVQGWYSALNLPALFILFISVVYFVEIVAVGFTYGYLIHPESVKKRVWVLISIIIFGLVLSVILQNVMPSTQQMSAAV
jgi:hypothetical protein